MFLSNANSFVLIRRKTAVKPISPVFLTNTDDFVLEQKTGDKFISSAFLPNRHSFVLKRNVIAKPNLLPEKGVAVETDSQVAVLEEPKINDHKKRHFLKVASIAGAGIVASQLLPKKAEALIMGSSPTTGVVGLKNSSNVRINPATEETLDEVLKTSDLTFDGGALEVKVTSVSGGSGGTSSFSDSGDVARSALVDAARHVQVDVLSSSLPSSASTETTLQTISFGGYKFSVRLATVGDIDYVGEAAIGTATSAASWRIKRIDNASGVVVQWAGTGVFDQIWDNRASLTYS